MGERGLVLGKFMPLHKGHQHLIDAARARVGDENLTILVCSLERELIPGHLRLAWAKELYPHCNVVHLTDDIPQEPKDHPQFWEIWTAAIRRFLPRGPDWVFTSETYGDELARRLGARHALIDLPRASVPVSGTAVRADPFAHWKNLAECVRAYFVKRVVVYGPESTGKTTLARQLAERSETAWVPEFAREYLDNRPTPPRPGAICVAEDLPEIARGQIAAEDAAARRANRLLFCDTDLHTTAIYSRHFFGACAEWVEYEARTRPYALHLLLDVDVPWVADPHRDLGHARREMFERFRAELDSAGRKYVVISGDWDERISRACHAINGITGGWPTRSEAPGG